MKERPILFKGEMVRAILAGTKTQTRRVVNPQPPEKTNSVSTWHHPKDDRRGPYFWSWGLDPTNEMVDYIQPDWAHVCPYGKPGDRLWVREIWAHDAVSDEQCRAAHEDAMGGISYGPYYRATEVAPDTLRWKPSIFMPRWASRITLEVTGVRVERLQDISQEDAVAEGVDSLPMETRLATSKLDYRWLWESINGAGSWDKNPWVWVVEFKRV